MALILFINVPSELYHSCENDFETHHSDAISFEHAEEECLICEFTFSAFQPEIDQVFVRSVFAFAEYQSQGSAFYCADVLPYCEGRAPPVLA